MTCAGSTGREAESMIGMEGMLGATFTPHCAAIQPALLARGLAEAVERRGVPIYEHTEVIDIVPGGPGRVPGRPHHRPER